MKKLSIALTALLLSSGAAHANYNGHYDAINNDTTLTFAIGESTASQDLEFLNISFKAEDEKYDSYKLGLSHNYGDGYIADLFAENLSLKDESLQKFEVNSYRLGFGKEFGLDRVKNTTVFAKAGVYHFIYEIEGQNDEDNTGLYLGAGFNTDLGNDLSLTGYARHYVNNDYLGELQAGVNLTYAVSSNFDLFVNAEHMIGKLNVEMNSLHVGASLKF